MDKLLEAINDLPKQDNKTKELYDEQDHYDEDVYELVVELVEKIIEAQDKDEKKVIKTLNFNLDDKWYDLLDDMFYSKGYNFDIDTCCSYCNKKHCNHIDGNKEHIWIHW